MFYRKFDDEGNNPVDNPNIYNVEGDYRLSPSLQPLTTGSVLKIRFFLIRFRNFFFIPEIILLSSAKTKHSSINKTIIAFI